MCDALCSLASLCEKHIQKQNVLGNLLYMRHCTYTLNGLVIIVETVCDVCFTLVAAIYSFAVRNQLEFACLAEELVCQLTKSYLVFANVTVLMNGCDQ